MLSKSQISFVNALHQKKFRKEHHLFIVEGVKSITEFLDSDYTVNTIYYTPSFEPKLDKLPEKVKLIEVTEAELKKISSLSTPQDALAVVEMPARQNPEPENFRGKTTLVLDGIQDPGNLGTIIRTADWFGFREIICSEDTVEAYNPKVVQATMGSLSRMRVYYTQLDKFLETAGLPVFGALLDGRPIYEVDFGQQGFVVLGNEGNGISEKVRNKITIPVTIPRFGNAESLNVAISAAIFCSELKRKV